MSWKLAILLTAASQILAQRIGTTQTRSQVTSRSSTSTAATANTIALPADELLSAQSTLMQQLQTQTSSLQQTQLSFDQQFSSWYFSSPSLRTTFDESFSTVNSLVDQAKSYLQGANELLSAMQSVDAGIKSGWIERVLKLQGLAKTALSRASEGQSSYSSYIQLLSQEQQVYTQAKQQQLLETKSQMDNTLYNLRQQTIKIGGEASSVIQAGIGQWAGVLQQLVPADLFETKLAKMQQITQRTLVDLSNLRPEDIEQAFGDAHRCMDEIKRLFQECKAPDNVVRQVVNPVQIKVFAILTQARSIH